MKYVIILFLPITFFGGCGERDNLSVKNGIDTIPNTHIGTIQYKKNSTQSTDLLKRNGINFLGSYAIKMRVDSLTGGRTDFHSIQNSFLYCVIVSSSEKMKLIEKTKSREAYKHMDHKLELLYFKDLHSYFNNLKCGIITNNELEFEIINDIKVPSILKNDSIYLSLDGANFWTLPIEGSLSYGPSKTKRVQIKQGVPIGLISGEIRVKNKENVDEKREMIKQNEETIERRRVYFQIGVMTHDDQKYRFSDFFNSNKFKSYVLLEGMSGEMQDWEYYNENFDLSNFKARN